MPRAHNRNLLGFLRGYRAEPGGVNPQLADELVATVQVDDLREIGSRILGATAWMRVSSGAQGAGWYSGLYVEARGDGAWVFDLRGSIADETILVQQRDTSVFTGSVQGPVVDVGDRYFFHNPGQPSDTRVFLNVRVAPIAIPGVQVTLDEYRCSLPFFGPGWPLRPIYVPPGAVLIVLNATSNDFITLSLAVTDPSLAPWDTS